ncbi:hypothetical protein AK812_SmicGene40047 [Symbiodinium microadriaticum]|uniref:Uncharacterized protein n=1 Tax=Symbiodinium microadriaticum TaxID=2951 RepID=A0A1Q9C9N1_SYMMI|nr:hypothetical protein AK812_SmicGene40047 [Symbiodinium microadriaticum]
MLLHVLLNLTHWILIGPPLALAGKPGPPNIARSPADPLNWVPGSPKGARVEVRVLCGGVMPEGAGAAAAIAGRPARWTSAHSYAISATINEAFGPTDVEHFERDVAAWAPALSSSWPTLELPYLGVRRKLALIFLHPHGARSP